MAAEPNGQLRVVPPAPPPFRREGTGYIFEPPKTPVRFLVDRLHRSSEGMQARIAVESTLEGHEGHMYRGRHRLEGSRSMADLEKALEKIAGPEHKIPWGSLLRTLTVSVVDAEEAGEPFVVVGGTARPRLARPPDTVEKLLPAGKPTQWYGAGSAGKGYIAIAACIAVASGIPFTGLSVTKGEVLYLDWEDDQATFEERVAAVATGMGIPPPRIHYRSCRGGGPLHEQIDTIARYVDRHGIALTVIDSVSMAGGMSSERSSYEETAVRLMTAVSLLRSTVLLIDHVNAEGKEGKGLAGRSYGSVFKGYLCRSTWEVRKEQEAGDKMSHVAFHHTKTNHSEVYLPIGFQLDFTEAPDTVRVTRWDVRYSVSLSEGAPLEYLIDHALSDGAKTVTELEEMTGAKANSIRVTLNRGQKKGKYIRLKEGARGTKETDTWGRFGE